MALLSRSPIGQRRPIKVFTNACMFPPCCSSGLFWVWSTTYMFHVSTSRAPCVALLLTMKTVSWGLSWFHLNLTWSSHVIAWEWDHPLRQPTHLKINAGQKSICIIDMGHSTICFTFNLFIKMSTNAPMTSTFAMLERFVLTRLAATRAHATTVCKEMEGHALVSLSRT